MRPNPKLDALTAELTARAANLPEADRALMSRAAHAISAMRMSHSVMYSEQLRAKGTVTYLREVLRDVRSMSDVGDVREAVSEALTVPV